MGSRWEIDKSINGKYGYAIIRVHPIEHLPIPDKGVHWREQRYSGQCCHIGWMPRLSNVHASIDARNEGRGCHRCLKRRQVWKSGHFLPRSNSKSIAGVFGQALNYSIAKDRWVVESLYLPTVPNVVRVVLEPIEIWVRHRSIRICIMPLHNHLDLVRLNLYYLLGTWRLKECREHALQNHCNWHSSDKTRYILYYFLLHAQVFTFLKGLL